MRWKGLLAGTALTIIAGLGPAPTMAAAVDLATVPMISGLSKVVPPNIHFILDDSTSMNWEFMPDAAWAKGTSNCFKNHGYNKVYYNPDVVYAPPKQADGTDYPNSSFNAAWNDGFNVGKGTTDLRSKFRAYVTGDNRNLAAAGGPGAADAEQAAYYYRYTVAPASPPSTCAANGQYTLVRLTVATVAQRQNFANWYSYYRTRMLTMKSAAGRAFAGVDEKFRVGYVAISESNPRLASAKFLNLARFEGAHRTNWYSKLYGAGCPVGSGCGTPLRGALSKAGQVYAGKVIAGDSDPVQYSCQQNFSILTTDGYWNTGAETASYGPLKIDNVTKVGDQDGVAGTLRPYLDAGKYPNSLADIAMYYYKTDLRPAAGLGGKLEDGSRLDVSTNNVPSAGADEASHQHMTTFTLGMGVNGVLGYSETYATGGSPDYTDILQGSKNWPNPDTASPDNTVVARIDDLWHAAVNGRGQYLSASTPDSLVSALRKTLAAISVSNASAAAAATSSLEPVAGDNYAYVAQYTTGLWYGDLLARDIDLITGALSDTVKWSAREQLVAKVDKDADSRNIYTFSPAAATRLREFTFANLAVERAAGYFRSDGANPLGALTQFDSWDALQKAAATDDAMIAFLRGQNGREDEADNAMRLFRDRTFALGDIVNASPVFVGKPDFKYGDADYSVFAAAKRERDPIVYVGANDGMLHALDAVTGVERWAYVPSAVIPRLYKLADATYAGKHEFFVDGPITVGDAYDGSEWKTVLIGGLGRGGRAYYALDVTDPANPRALWEFGTGEDSDLGYSYGNPILTKRSSDGRWVVVFASGYNNSAPGDAKGRLYVVDAFTGARLREIISDGAVADADVSGIAKINNFVANSVVDNTTEYVYGGDLGGSLWRFDITGGSQRLGRTSAVVGNQPITVRPELGRVKGPGGVNYRSIYFGTGRYLGFGDLAPAAPSSAVAQAVYAVKDTGEDLGVLTAAAAKLVEQTLDASVTPRTIPSPVAVDWSVKNGWFMNLPVGERVNVDPRLQLGSLVLVANEPTEDYCEVGGKSWLYTLDFRSGGPVVTEKAMEVGQPIGASIATGLTLIRLPTNKLIAIVTQADTTVRAMTVPVAPSAAVEARRVGWREIF